jgi:hypothetical protein
VQLRNGFNWVSTLSFFRNYSVVNALPVPPFTIFANYLHVGRSVSDIINPFVTNSDGALHQLGDVLPTFTVNANEALNLGPFRFAGLLQWNKGGQLMNQTELYYDFGSLWGDSAYAANWASRWNANAYNWIESAAFVKLRSMSLSYTVPAKWVSQVAGGRVSSARLSLVGRNLAQWYGHGYTGLDPEVSGAGNQNLQRGIEITPYPPSRSFFLSLDLGF